MELSAPERKRQESIKALQTWTKARVGIVGTVEQPTTLAYLEGEQKALDESLPSRRKALRRARNRKFWEIHATKRTLLASYRQYFGDAQQALEVGSRAIRDSVSVRFGVAIAETGFARTFLQKINQRKAGAYTGADDGKRVLERQLLATDWDNPASVLRFARNVVRGVKISSKWSRPIAQLKSEEDPVSFYYYIFGLEYLEPMYQLTANDKRIDQLSPGERGHLLLIFYLLVDRDDIPLVIDQPEENLDNHTVFKTLVPCIKIAKRRRQVIIVTHNPNLAVACDAEQIIAAEMTKQGACHVLYVSGSIEERGINKRLVDVLEGTRPAFDKRDASYLE
ncbi:MAG: ATP-binding protein [Planctomycetes bacterium]|nr:ATP-binding protein [Planctomycetota bacterium]MCC7173185.1 ATP-binding protein [Planctomycetota bacterium]